MMVLFEVIVAPGSDPDTLLSPNVIKETMAQVMTPEDAKKVGFAGLPERPGQTVRFIAVAARDAPWIHRALETSDAVGTFARHDID
ncbi:MAG: hypothetical protein U0359_09085 [Byssovorax sp.]